MTWKEAYTSLKYLYKKLMFEEMKWTLSEIDSLDVHFFEELTSESIELDEFAKNQKPQEKDQYLSDIWL